MSSAKAKAVTAVWSAALPGNYRTVAGAALFAYDSCTMFPAEISQDMYWGTQTRSIATTVYPIMKVMGILYFIGSLYQHVYPSVSPAGCLIAVWTTGVALDIGYMVTIKTILVLRLRAIYRGDRTVSIILYTLMALELLASIVALISFAVTQTKYPAQVPSPFPGCWQRAPKPPFSVLYDKSGLVLWATRFSTTTIEALMMLLKLSEALNKERRLSDRSLLSAIVQLRHYTPVLYIFYRDGALLFIPIFILNTLGCLSKTLPRSLVGRVDWSLWLVLAYQIFGSRLILNIRRANEKLTGSMVPQYLSALRFDSENTTTDEFKPGTSMVASASTRLSFQYNHQHDSA